MTQTAASDLGSVVRGQFPPAVAAILQRFGEASAQLRDLLETAPLRDLIGSTDAVTWFDEDTPAALIEVLRPDVLVKGGDWPVEKIVGGRETLARGGRVLSIPFEHQRSSTALLERIRKG